ncbi:MAG: hypothetical protein WAK57_04045 [Desulfobacterales bacterium]|jgi:hypothetical protein
MLLSEFGNEVLSRGSAAVLPQNLNQKWLGILQRRVDDFIDSHFEPETCPGSHRSVDPLLTACVSEILHHQEGDSVRITEEDLIRKTTIYAVAVTMESIHRGAHRPLEPPTLDNIFATERLVRLKTAYPELEAFLERVCVTGATV